MYHPIAERRGFYNPLFGLGHDKLAISPVLVCFARQLPTQREQIFFKLVAEFQNGTAVTLADARAEVGGVEIFKLDDAGE